MRNMFFVLSVAVVTVFVGARAEAQNYPWCALYSGGRGGGATNCGFTTFQQCLDTVSGIGGFCQLNDTYHPPGGAPLRHKSHAHY
jgi:Protein of unknown function (DUF3551)